MIPISTLVLSSCFIDNVVVMPIVVVKYDNINEETWMTTIEEGEETHHRSELNDDNDQDHSS